MLEAGGSQLRDWLQGEASFQNAVAIDNHVITQINAATPDEGRTGDTLIAQLRYGVAALRDSGYAPTLAALEPLDAAELDLTTTNAGYVFGLQATGNSSPLFGLQIVEVAAGIIAPLLVDPQALGVLYLGNTKVDIDSGGDKFGKNLSSIRARSSVLYVVRQSQAAYIVSGHRHLVDTPRSTGDEGKARARDLSRSSSGSSLVVVSIVLTERTRHDAD